MGKRRESNVPHVIGGGIFLGVTLCALACMIVVGPNGLMAMGGGGDPASKLQFMAGWTSRRAFSMTLTSRDDLNMKGMMTIVSMKDSACTKSSEYLQRSATVTGLAKDFISRGCNKYATKVDTGVAGFNAVVGVLDPCSVLFDCSSWDLCRNHIMGRCGRYKTLLYGGSGTGLFCLVAGALCALGASVYVECEPPETKSVAKQKSARAKTFGLACGGTLCSCSAGLIFIGIIFSSMTMKDCRIPDVYFGPLIGLFIFGLFIMMVISCGTLTRMLTVRQAFEWDS